MAELRPVRAVAALLSAEDLQDIEALLSSHRLAFDTLAIEAAHAKGTLKDAVQVADFQEESRAAEEALRLAYERLTQQEAAMQAEREEAHAEIAELHEQLNSLRQLQMAQLQRGGSAADVRLCDQVLDLQRRSQRSLQWRCQELCVGAAFAVWRIRTVAFSAKVSERARLRMEWRSRVERLSESLQSLECGLSFTAIFRAWAEAVNGKLKRQSQGVSRSNSRIHLFRCLQAWRRVAIAMASLQHFSWIEPSQVCSPEFASAAWQMSPRVYRAVLLSASN
ncbi:Phosphodiesterase [Durusdinium trenchii]|uniref:Phosphodiesterase n=1 Tax=Durusdinium trenchii TaxID=1381693 RepID=A0ABP0R4F6_9DINO